MVDAGQLQIEQHQAKLTNRVALLLVRLGAYGKSDTDLTIDVGTETAHMKHVMD